MRVRWSLDIFVLKQLTVGVCQTESATSMLEDSSCASCVASSALSSSALRSCQTPRLNAAVPFTKCCPTTRTPWSRHSQLSRSPAELLWLMQCLSHGPSSPRSQSHGCHNQHRRLACPESHQHFRCSQKNIEAIFLTSQAAMPVCADGRAAHVPARQHVPRACTRLRDFKSGQSSRACPQS